VSPNGFFAGELLLRRSFDESWIHDFCGGQRRIVWFFSHGSEEFVAASLMLELETAEKDR
jgi:hypothetical protein